MISRRGFMFGCLTAGVTPACVKDITGGLALMEGSWAYDERLGCYTNPVASQRLRDLAVQSTGLPWRTENGLQWVRGREYGRLITQGLKPATAAEAALPDFQWLSRCEEVWWTLPELRVAVPSVDHRREEVVWYGIAAHPLPQLAAQEWGVSVPLPWDSTFIADPYIGQGLLGGVRA